MKSPRLEAAATDPVLKALSAKGEAFLQMFADAADGCLSPVAPSSPECTRQTPQSQSTGAPSKAMVHRNEVEELVFQKRRQSGSTASSSTTGHYLLSARKAKRLFMSGKASDVHSEASWRPPQSSKSGQGMTPGKFREMQREVDTFGAAGLSKRQQQLFDATQLKRLNVKAERKQRTPASIGKGIAAKRAEREQKALQEAIDTGMVQLKGMGKRKRRQKEQARKGQPGLLEDGGAFRNGMLNLKRMKGAERKKGRSA